MLDNSYACALTWAGLKEGWIGLSYEARAEGYTIARAKHFLEPRRASRFVPHALQLATLYESVGLHALPGASLFDFSRLQREGLVVDALGLGVLASDLSWDEGYITARVQPLLPELGRRCRSRAKDLDPNDYRILDEAGYQAITLATAGLLDAYGIRSGDELNALCNSFTPHGGEVPEDLRMGFVNMVRGLARRTGLSDRVIINLMARLLLQICSILQIESISSIMGVPYVSDLKSSVGRGSASSPSPSPTDLTDVYEICCITMREVVDYAPHVDTLDDVLRLRNDPRIEAFRVAILRWAGLLRTGTTGALQDVRNEVAARNRELMRLRKWKRVDRFMFWTSVPALLIPVLSTLYTVFSFGLRWHTERAEKQNWLCLGR
jgi:hypothetical protein